MSDNHTGHTPGPYRKRPSIAQRLANARLIAAAPTLLAERDEAQALLTTAGVPFEDHGGDGTLLTLVERIEVCLANHAGALELEEDATISWRNKAKALEAQLTARAKSMLKVRDVLVGVMDDVEDEGGRVYFGSTNHCEMLREVSEDLDEWAWSDIISDANKPDYAALDAEHFALEEELHLEREMWPSWAITLEKFMRERMDLNADEGVSLDDVTDHIAEMEHLAEKAMEFKTFVHKRLDDAGVPAYPDGPHSKEGCRIGDRLDIVLASFTKEPT